MLRWTAKQPHIKLLFTGGYHSIHGCCRITRQYPCEVIVLLSRLHSTMWGSRNMSRDRGFAMSAAPELLRNHLGVRLLSRLKVHTNLQTSVFVLWYFMLLTGIGLVSQCDYIVNYDLDQPRSRPNKVGWRCPKKSPVWFCLNSCLISSRSQPALVNCTAVHLMNSFLKRCWTQSLMGHCAMRATKAETSA